MNYHLWICVNQHEFRRRVQASQKEHVVVGGPYDRCRSLATVLPSIEEVIYFNSCETFPTVF